MTSPTDVRMPMRVRMLGQAGLQLSISGCELLIDPYLTDSVAETFGSELRRMVPSPLAPKEATGIDWVLITHEHLDHLDPESVLGIAEASPRARFMCPRAWHQSLVSLGVGPERLVEATETWQYIASGCEVRAVPAAHPDIERDEGGALLRVGYLLRTQTGLLYHAGDTSANDSIRDAVLAEGPVSFAFLPVNERNHYRDRAGILGNMTVREALAFADEIFAETIIPIHWDLFRPNCVPRAEIELLHAFEGTRARLVINPVSLG